MDISVSLFIVLGYLITMTGGKRARPGPAICARLCEKFAGRGRGSRRWWRAASRILRPRIERRNDLSPSPRTCTPAKLFFFRNVDRRYFYILIDPPTVELALVVAKVAAGVFEEAERGLRASRSESNSNRASWR